MQSLFDKLPYVITSHACAGIMSCIKGQEYVVPIDITTDYRGIIPVLRTITSVATQNTDFSGRNKSPTMQFLVSKGLKIGQIYLIFRLPQQIAHESCDRMAYDDLPGINCIDQIEFVYGGQSQMETIRAHAIIQRLLKNYPLELFKEKARRFWGDYRDANYIGKYQKPTGCPGNIPTATYAGANVIFPPIRIVLPLPSSLMFNEEKFNFYLGTDSIIEAKIIFKASSEFISRTQQTTLVDMTGTIEQIQETLLPNEVGTFFTGLPYGNVDLPYVITDHHIESQQKPIAPNLEFKLDIKRVITHELQLFAQLQHFQQGLLYGFDVEDAISNYICAMTTVNNQSLNVNYTINLNTGLFLTGSATSGTLSIVNWANGASSFQLVWQRNSTTSTIVTINSPTPFGTFGDMYLDLSSWSPQTIPTNGFSNIIQAGLLFMCKSVNLDIRPYNNLDNSVYNAESNLIIDGTAKKLARGMYSFNPDPQVPGSANRHALWGATVEKSPLLEPADLVFDFFCSLPVPTPARVNKLVERNFVRTAKGFHCFWDLNGKWPINIDKLNYQKATSNQDQYNSLELELARDPNKLPSRWDANAEICYSYGNQHDKNLNSYGYTDFRSGDVLSYTVEIVNPQILYDQEIISDFLKEMTLRTLSFVFMSLQHASRIFVYQNSTMYRLTDADRQMFNEKIREKILIPNGLYIPDSEARTVAVKRSYDGVDERDYGLSAVPNSRPYPSIRPMAAPSVRPAVSTRPYAYDPYSSSNNIVDRLSKRPKFY